MSVIETEIINVCLTVGDFTDMEYCKHAAVTMLSLSSYTQSKIKWYLISGNGIKPPEEMKNMFESIGDVEYGYINIDKKLSENLYSFKTFTKYSALRLFLPELYPNLHKILYFDCDIVCNGINIEELWSIPVKTIGAVTEGCYKNRCGRYAYNQIKNLGIHTNEYFNSGVLIMNLDNLRDLPEKIQNNLPILKNCSYFDQDALNYLYPNAIRIPDKYNWIIEYHKGENSNNRILHFPTWMKPYKSYLYPETYLYWKYRFDIETLDSFIKSAIRLPNLTKKGFEQIVKNTKLSDLILLIKMIVKLKAKQLLLKLKRQ